MAKLIFKYSTMNSGKTIDLIRTIHNYEENNCKIILMKPSKDTKAGDCIQTRIGLKRKVDFLIDETISINVLLKGKLEKIKCIFVDEAQFLNINQVDELFIITKALDIPVICYGLRSNFKLEAFEGSKRLLEVSDILEEFKTLCKCGQTARYVGRKSNGIYEKEGNEVVIDGTEKVQYVPLCGKCYLEKVREIDFSKFEKEMR